MIENIICRTVIQRAKHAEVQIDQQSRGKMEYGLVLLFGIGFKDIQSEIYEENVPKILKEFNLTLEKLAEKIVSLRIFSDKENKMNLSVKDVKGGIYLVSQFTLFADCRKGNRPSFTHAANPILAKPMYETFAEILKQKMDPLPFHTGVFAANMQVSFCNDGPVTLIIESSIKGIL